MQYLQELVYFSSWKDHRMESKINVNPSSSNTHPDAVSSDETAISGYLYKKTRDGRWQKRWFETNGVYLTYYKTRKMEKLLAALSLPQVGDIKTLPAEGDPENHHGLFTLELNTRIYTLRAKSDIEAESWVKTLNYLREEGQSNSVVHKLRASNQLHDMGVRTESDDLKNAPAANAGWIKTGKTCFGCC